MNLNSESENMAQKRKTPLIKKHGSTVMAIMQSSPKIRKKLVKKASAPVIKCVSECCHNVLKGHVPLTEDQKKKLHSKRQQLRNLASKSVSIHKKKRILNQKGGFLPLLLGPLLPTLAKAVVGGIGGVIKSL